MKKGHSNVTWLESVMLLRSQHYVTGSVSVKSDPSSIHDPAAKVSEGAESMKKYGFVLKHPPLS